MKNAKTGIPVLSAIDGTKAERSEAAGVIAEHPEDIHRPLLVRRRIDPLRGIRREGNRVLPGDIRLLPVLPDRHAIRTNHSHRLLVVGKHLNQRQEFFAPVREPRQHPDAFGILVSVFIVLYVVLGGANNMWGPPLGAAIMTLLPELVRGIAEWRPTVADH